MQLPDHPDVIFPEATFAIPDAPPAIEVNQSGPVFPTSIPVYHLLSDIDTYVHINITDNYARLPYAIYKKEGEFLKDNFFTT